MKRDMELVRRIAFIVEEIPEGECIRSDILAVDGYDRNAVAYHCRQMEEDELVQAIDLRTRATPNAIGLCRLTVKGHDFVDAARSDTVWNKAMTVAKEKGVGMTIDLTVRFLTPVRKSMLGLRS